MRDTRARLEKIAQLAELLRRLDPSEVPIAIGFLSTAAPMLAITVPSPVIPLPEVPSPGRNRGVPATVRR